jgi:hypothetical protein
MGSEMIETTPMTPQKRRSRIQDEEKLDPEERELTTAELAECTCPEFCERDHETD